MKRWTLIYHDVSVKNIGTVGKVSGVRKKIAIHPEEFESVTILRDIPLSVYLGFTVLQDSP